MSENILRRAVAEGFGTGALVLGAFGGGHLAGKLGATPAEGAIVGTLAVAATLVAVLHAIGGLTGGHVNPAVTVSCFVDRSLDRLEALAYIAAQLVGAVGGALVANALWEQAAMTAGSGSVTGLQCVAEVMAAGGLVALIHGSAKGGNGGRLPFVVPAFVVAASFAAPFGFANPAVTVAKALAGGGPGPAALVGLLVCEVAAAAVAVKVVGWLYTPVATPAEETATAVTAAPAQASIDAPSDGIRVLTTPSVARTFELAHGALTDGAAHVLHDVAERLVRSTDLVVKHRDGRLLVLLDSADATATASFERRINDHVTVALMAAGEANVGIRLVPVDGIPAVA